MIFRLLSGICISEGFLLKVILSGLLALPFYFLNPFVPVLVMFGFTMRAILEIYFPTYGMYVIYRIYGSDFLAILRRLDTFAFIVLNGFNFFALAVLFMGKPGLPLELVFSQIKFFNWVLVWSLTYIQTLAVYSFYSGQPWLLRSGWVLLSTVFVVLLGASAWIVAGFEHLTWFLLSWIMLLGLWYFLPMKLTDYMNKNNMLDD